MHTFWLLLVLVRVCLFVAGQISFKFTVTSALYMGEYKGGTNHSTDAILAQKKKENTNLYINVHIHINMSKFICKFA